MGSEKTMAKMTVAELRAELKARGLSTQVRKSQI
jgi:SAP domain